MRSNDVFSETNEYSNVAFINVAAVLELFMQPMYNGYCAVVPTEACVVLA